MKGLECVKQKISHILVHVNTYDASIEIINYASAIHDLKETKRATDIKINKSCVLNASLDFLFRSGRADSSQDVRKIEKNYGRSECGLWKERRFAGRGSMDSVNRGRGREKIIFETADINQIGDIRKARSREKTIFV